MTSRSMIKAVLTTVLCLTTLACANQEGVKLDAFKKQIPATIFFIGPNAASCVAKVSPYRLQPKKKEFAYWTIIDLCGITGNYAEDVELKWPSSNPECDSKKTPLVTPAIGKVSIIGEVNEKCTDGQVFSYEIWIKGTKVADPELEIAS